MYSQQCQICCSNAPKYRCPHCQVHYCSLPCFKSHKQPPSSMCDSMQQRNNNKHQQQQQMKHVQQESQEVQPELIKTDYVEDEALRLSSQELARLKDNAVLVKMLESKDLRDKIAEIDNSRMRLNMLQKALLDQQFMKFADEALRTLGKSTHR